jgi:parallel beta-helix repeat protein
LSKKLAILCIFIILSSVMLTQQFFVKGQQVQSTITLNANNTEVQLDIGSAFTGYINGQSSSDKTGTIYLKISTDQTTWSQLATVQSDATGYYWYWWVPSSAGTYYFYSTWNGNSYYSGSQSNIATVKVNAASAYIRNDGSVDPGSAPISRNGNIYTFVSNIANSWGLVVEKANIVIDGAGHSMTTTHKVVGVADWAQNGVTIKDLNLNGFSYGIYLHGVEGCLLTGNTISNAQTTGIGIDYSSNNVITENMVNNCQTGMALGSSSQNQIYHNNLIGNQQQSYAYISSQTNKWDNGYPSGGNYWTDYNGKDSNYDGLGDSNYIVDTNNIDHYPLMQPYAASTKQSSTISCSVDSNPITFSQGISASGTISPAHQAQITLNIHKSDGTLLIRTVTSTSSGSYTDTYYPDSAGSWTIQASWLGDTDHNGAQSQTISLTVKKQDTTITTDARPNPVYVNNNMLVTGELKPAISALITLTYTKPDGIKMTRSVESSSTGAFTDTFTPNIVGSWTVSATFSGDSNFNGINNINFPTPFTVKQSTNPSSITITSSQNAINQGNSITLSGTIIPGHAATVTLVFTKPDLSTLTKTITSLASGAYSYSFNPDSSGTWLAIASWAGDSDHNGATSFQTSFNVGGAQPPFSKILPWQTANGYKDPNFNSAWSTGGNCYGMSSTALLYYTHYTMSNFYYPSYPSQKPAAHSTQDLILPAATACDSAGNSIVTTLNNASLAIMFHQGYDPFEKDLEQRWTTLIQYQKQQLDSLIVNLKNDQPIVLILGDANQAKHAVVAHGISPNLNVADAYIISIYDPGGSSYAYYYPDSGFTCSGYTRCVVMVPKMIDKSWFPQMSSGLFPQRWLHDSVINYYIVIADKKATVTVNGKTDFFASFIDSQTFVCGIPDSCGFEEGTMQVYAIPASYGTPSIDPGSTESNVFISLVTNQSGKLAGYGYLLNAEAVNGELNYTVTPTANGLLLDTSNNGLIANVTFFTSNGKDTAIFQGNNVSFDARQSGNFSFANWDSLNSTNPTTLRISSLNEPSSIETYVLSNSALSPTNAQKQELMSNTELMIIMGILAVGIVVTISVALFITRRNIRKEMGK